MPVFSCEMVRSAQERFAIEKMAVQGMDNKKSDHVGLAAVDDEVVVPLKAPSTETDNTPVYPKWASRILKSAWGHIFASRTPENQPGAHCVF